MTATAHHVGITVSSLDDVLPFYRDVLGLDILSQFTVTGEAFSTGVGVEGATGNFAHLDADGIRVELVEYEPEEEIIEDVTLNRPGATHLGLEVDDIDLFYERLPEDVETISPPQTTESGTRICFLRDPEGNLVEILEQ
ncbi:VOC family protein [Natranaeroarchaeum aerophilus]|uniref:VOC family protein n=1 Tax=Natranaeroarchaeum aerophilus TaxID=2917711 RepID=A0AAE3FR87_9EURY|nr:VOC family protein [Natranaeroarchaeum aerophilus]MCL9814127.1 VOC family protein [Natranaeroarchaeum aerophilus]